jgi:hypothetical protein
MRNESFKKYVSNLKREDISIWKHIKNRRKPKTTSPPKPKTTSPPKPKTTSHPKPKTTSPPKPKTTSPPKPNTTSPPIGTYSAPPGPWAKSDKEKAELFENTFPKFSLHIIMIRTRKWNKTQLHPFNRKNALKHSL